MPHDAQEDSLWGAYPNYQDIGRFEYGRRLWRLPEMRARLVAHWTDPRHPYCHRFAKQRQAIENLLSSEAPLDELARRLRERGSSLRSLAREIPPVFGSFFR
jgi:hypothetical protein